VPPKDERVTFWAKLNQGQVARYDKKIQINVKLVLTPTEC